MKSAVIIGLCCALSACDVKQDLGSDGVPAPTAGITSLVPEGTEQGPEQQQKDEPPFTITFQASETNATTAQTIVLLAEVKASEAISKVWFSINDVALPSLSKAPYASEWPVAYQDNGTYSLVARVKDKKGNVAQSAPVSVSVAIPASPPITEEPEELEPDPPVVISPTFVSASDPTKVSNVSSFDVVTPADVASGDILLAIVTARDPNGTLALTTPAGWNLLVGYPMRNRYDGHSPYIIDPEENMVSWVMWRWANAATPSSHSLTFSATALLANASIVAYRNVDPAAPIDVHVGYDFMGDGSTNGFGSGNTNRNFGTEVALIGTAFSSIGQRTDVLSANQRVNSGESADGLNIIIHDTALSQFKIHYGPSVRHKRLPSNSTRSLLWNATMIVLNAKP